MYRFPWCFTLVSTNHASSNPGHIGNFTPRIDEKKKTVSKRKKHNVLAKTGQRHVKS